MIQIRTEQAKPLTNFWNHCLFHPTDAVEDPWGKRILDSMARDHAIRTIRIYSMFEDIVYIDEQGEMQFDFRLSDLRLDYLTGLGYDLLIAYAGIPDCIACSTEHKASQSKNKTRYKGKMFNTSPPRDFALWEEVCYQYTRHLVERYGIDTVSKWHFHCFNEPDMPSFFLSELPVDVPERTEAYCALYHAFERGVRRVSDRIRIGGPALTNRLDFLRAFLDYVRVNDLKLDYLALHDYGTEPDFLNTGTKPLSVENNMERLKGYDDVIREKGFSDREIILDEWGACTLGYHNREECPALMFRETEVFSAYYVKFISEIIHAGYPISKILLCLSGQHEMTEDFSGFRNFFTLNFIRKPIYNAFVLASRLGGELIHCGTETAGLAVVPTRRGNGDLAILLSYSGEHFEEDLPALQETVALPDGCKGMRVTEWRIDRETTNPYRLYQKMGAGRMDEKTLKALREEGTHRPVRQFVFDGSPVLLMLGANATVLIEIETSNESE